MAIVINSVPDGQVLDVRDGSQRNLSLYVSGLSGSPPTGVTASLGGTKASEFYAPSVTSVGTPPPTPPSPPGSLLVILTITGAVSGLAEEDSFNPGMSAQDQEEFTSALTVTITQDPLSSLPAPVNAYYLNEPNLLGDCFPD